MTDKKSKKKENEDEKDDSITNNDVEMKRLMFGELEFRCKMLLEVVKSDILGDDEKKEAMRCLLHLAKA
jgi:hypothetical protein